uniref:Major facilitator superfamily (MFS) profile domain-containing protein n=1 Tax=Oryza brachyantha TaxID=4533 RepID=J3N3B3_ORYBR
MENGAGGEEEYTRDGSVDLRGNPVLRSRRGGWRACSFIVVYELFERMAYYGIASNLVIYLTEKLHQGTVEAANNVTNWSGTVFITPLIGAVVADAYLGRYWTFVAGSAVYLMGMLLLTLAVSVPALKPPACDGVAVGAACPRASALQLGVYFGGLYIIALGHGGTKPNISTIGADQFDDFHPPEKLQKLSFFNWWMFTIFLGILFSTTVLVYLQDNVSWTVGYGIPTLGLMISVVVFLAGTPLYRHKVPQGSPLATMGRVIAAAVWKCRVPVPADSKELHELELEHYTSRRGFRMDTTSSMAFLNKAAVKSAAGGSAARLPGWTLCTVTQVEETKQIVKLVPLLATMVVPCTLVAQAGTLFVKQGVTLDRHIGKFHVPPASLGAFVTASMLVCIVLYDRFLVPAVRRRTKNPRGITLLQRISLGMLLQIVTMVVTSVVESQRLSYARRHGLVATGGGPAPADFLPPAAVRADGRRRRVPGGGPDRVLLRPGAGEHEEPRHGDVADGVWRREPAEQRHPHPGGARHRREGGAVGDEQPQRLAARLLLRVPRHPRRGEPAGVRRAQLQVLVPRRVDGDDRRRHGRSAGTARVSSEAAPMAA